VSSEPLKDTIALVVGATSGIGAEIARHFATCGATVIVAGRRRAAGEAVVTQIGPRATYYPVDATIDDDVGRLISSITDRHGRLDCAVNSAGTPGTPSGIADAVPAAFWATLRSHVGSTLNLLHHAGRAMIAHQRGTIIAIASIAGIQAGWTAADYATAKAAVVQLTRCAAIELAPHHIRVNSISPGPVPTGIFAKAAGVEPDRADQTANGLEPTFWARLQHWQPVPRVATTSDVAHVAAFLAGDAAAFITGQNVCVDGGITAGRPIAAAAADRRALTHELGLS
jgi:NAD(P)-dependent dehydrogenase (short-subunit alcohol dehydrogenase family)